MNRMETERQGKPGIFTAFYSSDVEIPYFVVIIIALAQSSMALCDVFYDRSFHCCKCYLSVHLGAHNKSV